MKLLEITNTPLIVEKLESDYWRINEDLSVAYHTDEGVYYWIIKKGFEFNFRSGGWALSIILPKIGSYAISWCVHDACYNDETVTRRLSDTLMKKSLRWYGLNKFYSWLATKAVRIGGASAYGDDQAELVDFKLLDK